VRGQQRFLDGVEADGQSLGSWEEVSSLASAAARLALPISAGERLPATPPIAGGRARAQRWKASLDAGVEGFLDAPLLPGVCGVLEGCDHSRINPTGCTARRRRGQFPLDDVVDAGGRLDADEVVHAREYGRE
jgi:hypothetical protein